MRLDDIIALYKDKTSEELKSADLWIKQRCREVEDSDIYGGLLLSMEKYALKQVLKERGIKND